MKNFIQVLVQSPTDLKVLLGFHSSCPVLMVTVHLPCGSELIHALAWSQLSCDFILMVWWLNLVWCDWKSPMSIPCFCESNLVFIFISIFISGAAPWPRPQQRAPRRGWGWATATAILLWIIQETPLSPSARRRRAKHLDPGVPLRIWRRQLCQRLWKAHHHWQPKVLQVCRALPASKSAGRTWISKNKCVKIAYSVLAKCWPHPCFRQLHGKSFLSSLVMLKFCWPLKKPFSKLFFYHGWAIKQFFHGILPGFEILKKAGGDLMCKYFR